MVLFTWVDVVGPERSRSCCSALVSSPGFGEVVDAVGETKEVGDKGSWILVGAEE